MTSTKKTKYKLADAIKKLMITTPLDRITVKDIVDECDMSRQTFYRHFQDKYDLVNWYFEKLVQQSFSEMGVSYSLRDALIKKFYFIEHERVFFREAFRSSDYNSLIHYDYQCIYDFYFQMIYKKLGRNMDESNDFLLRMYCRGSIAMTVEWVNDAGGMMPEEIADLLVAALPVPLVPFLMD